MRLLCVCVNTKSTKEPVLDPAGSVMSDFITQGPFRLSTVHSISEKHLLTITNSTASNLVTHGQLLCKEISDANIRT